MTFQPGFKKALSFDDRLVIGMIKNLGSSSDLVFCYDAADIASWPGSGQEWADVSGAGNDLWRGTDNTSQGNGDCTFNGTAGNKSASEYWTQPSVIGAPVQGLFSPQTNPPTYCTPWHKDNAAFTIIGVVWVAGFLAAGQQAVFRSSNGAAPGVEFVIGTSVAKKLQFNARKETGTLLNSQSSTDVVPEDAWTFVAVTVNEAASDGALFVNSSRTDFSAAYTSPSSNDNTSSAFVFGGFEQNSRVASVISANRAWSDGEIIALYNKLKANRAYGLP